MQRTRIVPVFLLPYERSGHPLPRRRDAPLCPQEDAYSLCDPVHSCKAATAEVSAHRQADWMVTAAQWGFSVSGHTKSKSRVTCGARQVGVPGVLRPVRLS